MKTLCVVNEKGGVGKTFVADQFAYFLHFKAGLNVLVIDLDQQHNTSEILEKSGLCSVASVTSGHIMAGEAELNETAPFLLVKSDDRLLELEKTLEEDEACMNLYNALENVKDYFDICIFDLNPSPDVRQLSALAVSTDYVVPFEVKMESIQGVEAVLTRARIISESLNSSLKLDGLLLSKVQNKGVQKVNLDNIIAKGGNLLLKRWNSRIRQEEGFACIYDRNAYVKAQQEHLPVFLFENAKNESAELTKVWVSLMHKIGLPVKKQIRIEKTETSYKAIETEEQGE